jgi:hypothetical protein
MGNSEKANRKKHKTINNLLPVRVVPQPGKSPGRKPAITPTVLVKLREAFLMGCDDLEACTFAGIAPATLYAHQKGNQTFSEWKEALKRTPFLKARKAIVNELEHNPEFAMRYMERKKKHEFAPQAKLTIDDQRETLDDETRELMSGTISQHLNKMKEKRDANGQVARSVANAN